MWEVWHNKDDLKFFRDRLAGHQIMVLEDGVCTKAYRLYEPNEQGEFHTRIMSTDIIFFEGRIIITGDLVPSRYGVISCQGYGAGWFSGNLSLGYMASKFDMDTSWDDEIAREVMFEQILGIAEDAWHDLDGDTVVTCKKLRDEMNDDHWIFETAHSLYDWLLSDDLSQEILGNDIVEILPSYTITKGDIGWLHAIQTRFAELYPTLHKETVTTT